MNTKRMAKLAGLSAAILAMSAASVFAATATASVNVRTGPGTQYRAVDTLRPGERVSIVDRAGGWCAIRAAGPDGWVSCRYLTDGSYRSREPSFRIEFGFGNDRNYRPHRSDRDRHWRDRGPGRGYPYSSGGGMFGLSLGN